MLLLLLQQGCETDQLSENAQFLAIALGIYTLN